MKLILILARRDAWLVAIGLAALIGCSGSRLPTPQLSPTPNPSATLVSTPTGIPTMATSLTFAPLTIQFPATGKPSQSVTVMKSSAIANPLILSFADPTVVGASTPTISGNSASFTVFGIANGQTTITATDGSGATGSLTAGNGPCGRPDNVNPAPILLSPQNGAAHVSTAVRTLYFGVYTVSSSAPVGLGLHMIVGAHGTFESGTLSVASLPAGAATAPPAPQDRTLTYMSGNVPTLTAGIDYRAQLYDDSCQPAEIAGSFST